MSRIAENNKAIICGEIVSDFRYSHEVFGEKFYLVDVKVVRLSEKFDFIPVMVSDRLMDVNCDCIGMLVSVTGQFRSYNSHEEYRNRLVLSVFAQEIEFIEELKQDILNNQIYLEGYVCKKPVYRRTLLGREITEVLLAVNRPYGKSDYIPCICWSRNARYAERFRVGERCAVWGRLQSREYIKRLSESETEKRIAYELSISKLEVLGVQ